MSNSHLLSPLSQDRKSALVRSTLLQKIGGHVNTQLVYVIAKLGIADLLIDGPKSNLTLARDL